MAKKHDNTRSGPGLGGGRVVGGVGLPSGAIGQAGRFSPERNGNRYDLSGRNAAGAANFRNANNLSRDMLRKGQKTESLPRAARGLAGVEDLPGLAATNAQTSADLATANALSSALGRMHRSTESLPDLVERQNAGVDAIAEERGRNLEQRAKARFERDFDRLFGGNETVGGGRGVQGAGRMGQGGGFAAGAGRLPQQGGGSYSVRGSVSASAMNRGRGAVRSVRSGTMVSIETGNSFSKSSGGSAVLDQVQRRLAGSNKSAGSGEALPVGSVTSRGPVESAALEQLNLRMAGSQRSASITDGSGGQPLSSFTASKGSEPLFRMPGSAFALTWGDVLP